jgi:hypothetical protein
LELQAWNTFRWMNVSRGNVAKNTMRSSFLNGAVDVDVADIDMCCSILMHTVGRDT